MDLILDDQLVANSNIHAQSYYVITVVDLNNMDHGVVTEKSKVINKYEKKTFYAIDRSKDPDNWLLFETVKDAMEILNKITNNPEKYFPEIDGRTVQICITKNTIVIETIFRYLVENKEIYKRGI